MAITEKTFTSLDDFFGRFANGSSNRENDRYKDIVISTETSVKIAPANVSRKWLEELLLPFVSRHEEYGEEDFSLDYAGWDFGTESTVEDLFEVVVSEIEEWGTDVVDDRNSPDTRVQTCGHAIEGPKDA